MPSRDIIVMGASAGGVEALRAVLAKVPKDLPASIFVVLHLSPDHRSVLPRILDAAGPLRATHAQDGAALERGHIYVAPPDQHLVLDDGLMRLTRSAREGGHRPAIDPLFRTAARFHGARVIGIVLSGALDDGSAGLFAVKQRGGIAIVQDPEEALCGDMPRSALENVEVDYCLPTTEIAKMLDRLSREPVEIHSPIPPLLEQETNIALERNSQAENPPGNPSEFACPSCGGVLNEVHDGKVLRFRCRVGHAYGVASLTTDQQDKVEAALWAALRALQDQIALNRRLAKRAHDRGHRRTAQAFEQYEESAREQADAIRSLLRKRERWVPQHVPARDPA
jgi:two-component system chemotaxis response regulator CheB